MTAYKNLMQRRSRFRCPGRPPKLRHVHRVPGPKRALRVKTRYFEPGSQKRIREKNAAEFARICKEIEAGMSKRQRRRRFGDTTPTAPSIPPLAYLHIQPTSGFQTTYNTGYSNTGSTW